MLVTKNKWKVLCLDCHVFQSLLLLWYWSIKLVKWLLRKLLFLFLFYVVPLKPIYLKAHSLYLWLCVFVLPHAHLIADQLVNLKQIVQNELQRSNKTEGIMFLWWRRVACQLLFWPRLNIFCLFRESVALFCIAWRVLTAVSNYPSTQVINLQSHHCFLRARKQIWTEMNLQNSQTVLWFLSFNLLSHLQYETQFDYCVSFI